MFSHKIFGYLLIIQSILILFNLTNAADGNGEQIVVDDEEYYTDEGEPENDNGSEDEDYFYSTAAQHDFEFLNIISLEQSEIEKEKFIKEVERIGNGKIIEEIAFPFMRAVRTDNLVQIRGNLDKIRLLNAYIPEYFRNGSEFKSFKKEVEEYLKNSTFESEFVKENFKELSGYLEKLSAANFPQIFNEYEKCESGTIFKHFKKNEILMEQLKICCGNVEGLLNHYGIIYDKRTNRQKIKAEIRVFLNNWEAELEKEEKKYLKEKEMNKNPEPKKERKFRKILSFSRSSNNDDHNMSQFA
ncbi:hypothetical protein Mgra_00000371 [Meloidogyne graminicola]|uniref:Uncharacterized protein n=1 Tax=Meloidogyne graminicola TaxID=189291 RepID=A0A8T0A2Z1_9BILA|nr:hypothetical protein Mgra_00000371 [Meloidogyne graminicola]